MAGLPAQVGDQVAGKAAQLLVDWAAEVHPPVLRRLGERILTHAAPDRAEAAELAAPEEAEARASDRRHVTLSQHPDGQVRLTGSLDAETAAVLRPALDPLTAPAGTSEDRTPGHRRHDALAEICRLALTTGQPGGLGFSARPRMLT